MFFFREVDLLTCKNQHKKPKQIKQQHKSTGLNNCQHFPCTDEADQFISSQIYNNIKGHHNHLS